MQGASIMTYALQITNTINKKPNSAYIYNQQNKHHTQRTMEKDTQKNINNIHSLMFTLQHK
jgi:hypothetical protein